jgi:hypothetical protein
VLSVEATNNNFIVLGFTQTSLKPPIYWFVKVNVLVSNVVDRGFVKVNVLASNVVDRGFEARLCKTKDYEIVMCCFYAKHAAVYYINDILIYSE